MNTSQALKIKDIMERAENQIKGNYRVYENLKREIDKLELRPEEREASVRRMAKILKV